MAVLLEQFAPSASFKMSAKKDKCRKGHATPGYDPLAGGVELP
jgi:hypothetical protein